jgi:hypothetical protein
MTQTQLLNQRRVNQRTFARQMNALLPSSAPVSSTADLDWTPPSLQGRSSAASPTIPQRIRRLFGVYRGRSRIRIGFRNVLTGRIERVSNHQTGAVVQIGRPKAAAGIRERNPFNFSIGSSPSEIAANRLGAFSTFSAIPYNFRGGYLAQYWSFRQNGRRITGRLSNTHQAEALAVNSITSLRDIGLGIVTPWPYTMRQNTRITGTITRSRIRVQIRGWDTGLSRAFLIRVNARRRR